ncbi:hypothetical protein ACFQY4_07440 [Catellatospora bangladeshensis]|uniref:hypothetical protein n=1 Tax=Catellatospora bangladeshensis TaxID=310355 RepID=UPI00360B9182
MRLLMVGADLPALAAAASDVDVTVLLGATTRDGGLPLPDGVRTVFVDDHKSIDAAVNGLLRAASARAPSTRCTPTTTPR